MPALSDKNRSREIIGKGFFVLQIVCMLGAILVASVSGQSPQKSAVSLEDIIEEITAGFGTYEEIIDGSEEKNVIVFQEVHTSIAGQIESAIMLNRLHDRGLKVIALEGVYENSELDAHWFHELSDNDIKAEVAVQLLKQGEISNAEFIALCYPDVKVVGIDDRNEYEPSVTDESANSALLYLVGIAKEQLSELSSEEIKKANELIEAEEYDEFINFIIESNPWTKDRFEKLYGEEQLKYSIEDKLSALNEIEDKADGLNVDIGEDIEEDFENLKAFYIAASRRSETFVENTIEICTDSPDFPVPMIIGAAHTSKVTDLLKEKGATYSVVSANSFADEGDRTHISTEQLMRKNNNLSVDRKGMLGSFLDGRLDKHELYKKPPSILDQKFARSKYELMALTLMIVKDARISGRSGPFPSEELKEELDELDLAKVDINSIKIEDGDVIFSCEASDSNDNRKEIYVRAHISPLSGMTIEEMLKQARADVEENGMDQQVSEENEENQGKPELMEISIGTLAMFSTDPEDVKAQIVAS